jgi:hypothetical protein
MLPESFTDWEGNPLVIGTRVFGDPEQPHGVVTGFTEPDWDDEPRRFYPPSVIVKWDEDEQIEFVPTYWTGIGPGETTDAPFQCDDLEVLDA